ncbi:MAG: sigma-54-dependent Fis family transcriptional regulator [Bacteroidales bacterium]|nr:sigma-54-dependent Fis family transcriptional regulator [Bacteroidales bacterium]
MVEEGQFREDLLYRINTIQIDVPPLRERREDIPGLIDFFLERFSRKYGHNELKLTEREMQRLQQYPWPGNVRELQHYIEKAVILSDSGKLLLEDPQLEHNGQPEGKPYASLNLEENESSIIRQAIREHNGNLSAAALELGISRKTLYNKIEKYGL